MIDVNEYQEKLEGRLLAANLAKLDKPVETKEVFYVGMCVDETLDFDMDYWNPAVAGLLKAVTAADVGEFYQLQVYYDDENTLWVTASRGDNSG